MLGYKRVGAALLMTTIAAGPAGAQHAASQPDHPPTVAPGTARIALFHPTPAASEQTSANVAGRSTSHVAAPQTVSAGGLEQVIHKGVIGNVLEVVPLEPENRVQLQRSGAIVNNTFTGRSIAVALGLASAPLMAVGLIWGLWSASKIKGVPAAAAPVSSLTPEPAARTATLSPEPSNSSSSANVNAMR
jgi:hypothetical protein